MLNDAYWRPLLQRGSGNGNQRGPYACMLNLHPPQVSPWITVMAGRCPDGPDGRKAGSTALVVSLTRGKAFKSSARWQAEVHQAPFPSLDNVWLVFSLPGFNHNSYLKCIHISCVLDQNILILLEKVDKIPYVSFYLRSVCLKYIDTYNLHLIPVMWIRIDRIRIRMKNLKGQ